MDVELTADEHAVFEELLISRIVEEILQDPKVYFGACSAKFAFLWNPNVSIEIKRQAILSLRTPNSATRGKACQDVLRHGSSVIHAGERRAFAIDVAVDSNTDLLDVAIFKTNEIEPCCWAPRFDPDGGGTHAEWIEAVRSLNLPSPLDLIRPGNIHDQSLSITGFTLPDKTDGAWRLCTCLRQVMCMA
jgi:hypothetical protein